LYPNYEDGNTKLNTTLELIQWKAETDLSDWFIWQGIWEVTENNEEEASKG
jgi:hypothetical protein